MKQMQFYQFVLCYYLKKHHKVKLQSRNIASVLFIVYYWQLLSLTLRIEEKNGDSQSTINLLNIFYYFYIIGRPYQYLLEFESFRMYSFIVPVVLLIFLSFEIWGNFIEQYVLQRQTKIESQTRQNDYSKFLSIMFQIHLYLLSLYSIDLFMISITEANTNLSKNLAVFVVSLVFLVFEITLIFMNILSSESIHFNSSPLHIDQISKNYFITILFIVFSIFLNNSDSEWKQLTNQILNFFIICFYLAEETARTNSFLSKISIIMLAYGFVYNLILMFYTGNSNLQEYQIVLLYILCPLFLNILFVLSENSNKLNFKKSRNLKSVYNNLILMCHHKNTHIQSDFQSIILKQLAGSEDQDIFLSELKLFNNKIIKSKKHYKAFWYQKYILIKHDLMEYTNTLALINGFLEQQFFSELNKQYIKVQVSISFLQNVQIEMIREEVYQLLYYNITKNDEAFKKHINSYINYKIAIQSHKIQLQQLMRGKASLYQLMQSAKAKEENLVYNECFTLTKESLLLKLKLKALLANYKTYKVQQLLVMLYVDFFNNIIEAELLKNNQLNDQDTKMIYLEQMEFLGLRLNDDMLNMTIIEKSEKFLKCIGYKKSEKIDDLIDFRAFFLNEFYGIHQMLISNFLQTGTCIKISKPYELYIRGFDNVYYRVFFQLNVQPYIQNCIQIYAFLKVTEIQPKMVLINNYNQIVGYSPSFLFLLEQLNIEKRQLFLSDANKLFNSFNKIARDQEVTISFNGSRQLFTAILKVRPILIELEILENQINVNREETINSPHALQTNLEPNQESLVEVPINIFAEEQIVMLSSYRKDETLQNLLSETKKAPLMRKHSKENSIKVSEQSKEMSFQKSKSVREEKQVEKYDDDQASSKFSRGFLDNSVFYSKYNQLTIFLEKNNGYYIYISILLFLVGLLVNFIFQIIILTKILPQFQEINDNSDLLAIKSNFITPVHCCVASQSCYINYFILQLYQQITAQQAYEKGQFSTDCVYKSYGYLKDSFIGQLQNENLESFLNDQFIELKQFEAENVVGRNLSLKNALYYYLQSEYFILFGQTYSDVSQIQISNNLVFFMYNLVALDDYFDGLSSSLTEFILNESITRDSDLTKFFLRLLFLQFLLVLLGLTYIIRNSTTLNMQFKLFTELNQYAIKLQLQNLNYVVDLLKSDNPFSLYNYDISIWEKKIQSSLTTYNLNINQNNRLEGFTYKPSKFKIIIALLAIVSFFFIPQIIIQYYDSDFYSKYQITSYWLQQLSEVSSAVVAVYGLRETNYQITGKSYTYSYFPNEDLVAQKAKILTELEKIGSFAQVFPSIDFSTMIYADSTYSVYSEVQSGNLCDHLIHFNKTLAQIHCDYIYNGVLKLGLFNSLSQIYNELKNEYENTQGFEVSLRNKTATFDEIEISLIVADVILYLAQSLFDGITQHVNSILLTHRIVGILYIIVDVIIFMELLFYYLPYLTRQADIIKNMIYLIPQHQFYLDTKFETNLRLLMIRNK